MQSCVDAVTTYTYDETGQPLSMKDPNSNITQYSYADNFDFPPSANTNAYVTKITKPSTNGVPHITKYQYGFNDGKLRALTDENNLVTTYCYWTGGCTGTSLDPLVRLTGTTAPGGGKTTIAYNDAALTVTTSKAINASQTVTNVEVFDGIGHTKQDQLTSDPQGTVFTDTAYDGLGRVYTVSNPYRSGTDVTTSLGTTTYFYDALSRKCLEVPPDGILPTGGACPSTQPANTIFTTYSGNTTTVTDQTGRSRASVTDSLGRLTQVLEDPGSTAHLNYETDYSYDALGNMLTVKQKGGTTDTTKWHTRTFTYDSLSRMLTSNNPEVGTLTYTYDPNSNVLTKKDARGITTNYSPTSSPIDSLNRVTAVTYSNGDPSIAFKYDESTCLTGVPQCNNIGHRTSMTDAAGSDIWAYDVPDRIHKEQRTTSGVTKSTTYNLDYLSNVTSVVYPTGRTVNYAYDSANRPASAADGSNGITYASGFNVSPGSTCAVGITCYTPQGTFYALAIGKTIARTGLNLTHLYNNRLQPQEFKASSVSSGANAIDITYSFLENGKNAGHVNGITNNLDPTRSQIFSYDQLNRITAAKTTSTYATSATHCWGETYTLDAWSNLQSIAPDPNYNGCTQESGFSKIADANNHLSSFSYDSSGNTQNDGTFNYVWDGESQLKSAGGVNYLYDGDGRRVSKSNGKLYWYGSGGEILAETDASGTTIAEYVFFGGKRIAMLPRVSIPCTTSKIF